MLNPLKVIQLVWTNLKDEHPLLYIGLNFILILGTDFIISIYLYFSLGDVFEKSFLIYLLILGISVPINLFELYIIALVFLSYYDWSDIDRYELRLGKKKKEY